MMKKSLFIKFTLTLILLLALILRLWGINWGFPLSIHADEPAIYKPALNIASTGILDQKIFNRPDQITIYLNSLSFYLISLGYNSINGTNLTALAIAAEHISLFLFFGRLLTVFFGLVGIFFTYKIGKLLFSEYTGLLAAFFLSILELHVEHSHYITPDVPITTLLTIAFYFLMLFIKKDKIGYLFLCAIFTGLSIAEKYPSIIFLGILYPALFFSTGFKSASLKKKSFLLIVPITTAIFTFLACCPFIIPDHNIAVKQFLFETRTNNFGQIHKSYFNKVYWYVEYALQKDIGSIFLIFAFLGGCWILIRRTAVNLFLLFFPILFLLCLSVIALYWERWIMPVTPFLCLLTAVTFKPLSLAIKKYKFSVLITVVLFIVIGTPVFLRTLIIDQYLSSKTTVDLEYSWWGIRKINPVTDPGIVADFSTAKYSNDFSPNVLLRKLEITPCKSLQNKYLYIVIASGIYKSVFKERNKYPQAAGCYEDLLKKKPLIVFRSKYNQLPNVSNDLILFATLFNKRELSNIFNSNKVFGSTISIYKFQPKVLGVNTQRRKKKTNQIINNVKHFKKT